MHTRYTINRIKTARTFNVLVRFICEMWAYQFNKLHFTMSFFNLENFVLLLILHLLHYLGTPGTPGTTWEQFNTAKKKLLANIVSFTCWCDCQIYLGISFIVLWVLLSILKLKGCLMKYQTRHTQHWPESYSKEVHFCKVKRHLN